MHGEIVCYLTTADMWSYCTSQPYICLTVHYIDSKWVLQSHCLQTHYIPRDHSGQQLQDPLCISLDEWYLDPYLLPQIVLVISGLLASYLNGNIQVALVTI